MGFAIRHSCLAGAFLALACGCLADPAGAQAFPSKNIRIIVPLPAGGSIDAIARQLAQKYTEAFSRSVLVDNRPGAGTNIGAELVARSAPDGHTWLMNSTAQAISAALYKNLAYDPEKDLAPVSPLMTNILVFVVASKVPVQSMKELIALMHTQPGKLNFGTTGIAVERDATMARLKDYGIEPITPPADRPYIEDAVRDPDGNKFDMSTTGLR